MKRVAVLLLAVGSTAFAQRGAQVFAQSCATGYCHGTAGASAGAPRLAARGFDREYISGVLNKGIPDTQMPSFASRLSAADLNAVIGYVASLNGVAPEGGSAAPAAPTLTGEAARGAQLFREATRGFGRCSTCHAVGGFGVAAASPITKVPANVTELKNLATLNVKTASLGGQSMPAVVVADSKQGAQFYDLTSSPPVLRWADAGAAKFATGGTWKHSSAISGYNDADLGAVLAYLRTQVRR